MKSLNISPNEKVAKYIMQKINNEELKEGDKLESERSLAKNLNVSRSSVREAIKHLTFLSYLESVEKVGTFITNSAVQSKHTENIINSIKLSPIVDLMELRMLIEVNFIDLAIERHTTKDINKLRKILESMKEVNKDEEDNVEYYYLDLSFHLAIADCTHNTAIIKLMEMIIESIKENEEYFILSGKGTIEKDILIFEKIINYIEAKDNKKAQTLYNKHLESVSKEIINK